jgi:hypothetical protein
MPEKYKSRKEIQKHRAEHIAQELKLLGERERQTISRLY